MNQEDKQNGQKSSFDRANDAVNKTRSAYKKIKNLKRAYRVVRTVQAAQVLVGGFSPIVWAIIASFVLVAASTVFLAMMGGGPGVNAGTPEEPFTPTNTECSIVDIPRLTCTVDDGTNGTHHVENGQSYVYTVSGNYKSTAGGRLLSSFVLKLTIPNDIIEFTIEPPGYFSKNTSGSTTTYTWLLTDTRNFSLFTQVEGSDPPEYNFSFSVTARPKPGVEDTIATVEFLIE